MHLHDVLRAWREEIIKPVSQVAIADGEGRGLTSAMVAESPRLTIPGRLRRDDEDVVQATLLPACHRPGRPASDDDLDALEERLGFELPRGIELMLRLHDGGEFYAPSIEDLPEDLGAPLQLLSAAQMVDAYDEIVSGVRRVLIEEDPDEVALRRLAGRFGARGNSRDAMALELGAVRNGGDRGLQILPLVLVAPSRNYLTFVPHSGAEGRVGYAFAEAGYLAEDPIEYAFDALEGWLLAVLRSCACRRIILT